MVPKQTKKITIVVPCYNEAGNIEELYQRVEAVFIGLNYDHEYLIIDNNSQDGTQTILENMAARDKRVKVILNARNFGPVRSPIHGLLQTQGDATIFMMADLQDPPEVIPEILKKWEEGHEIVMCVKTKTTESKAMYMVRRAYYWLVGKLSEVKLVTNFYGFGLYDRQVISVLRQFDDPYPYFRGLICEVGFRTAQLEYTQEGRKRGISKGNFYTLLDLALLGITYHSKVPLRVATVGGAILSTLSFFIGVGYFVAKLLYWDSFAMGIAPLVISLFFLSSIQLFFMGIIGEYIGNIYTQVLKRPLVVERKRINFD